jgi:hypothetical protein
MFAAVWRLFLQTSEPKKAQRLLGSLPASFAQHNSWDVRPYHKGGVVAEARALYPLASWEEVVCELLREAQLIGRCWTVTGHIDEALDLHANEFSVTGITFATVCAQRGLPSHRETSSPASQ